ncbi:MAG TPA: GNAT family N-acetyltransferase [Candidatus Angelobacter sp.]|nr:GNAT family N-acetyltransferase [Candidatus Angelobacter sp.]
MGQGVEGTAGSHEASKTAAPKAEGIVIETERLILRKFVPDDFSALAAVIGDPETMSFYDAPFDSDGVKLWIHRNIERYSLDGYGLWAMALKSSGEVIGDCGCVNQAIEDRTELEIGYHVRRDLWKKGYATEAALACMKYAFTSLGANRVISMIRPENLASRRVAEKNGLMCEKIVFWRGYDHCIYAKSRS